MPSRDPWLAMTLAVGGDITAAEVGDALLRLFFGIGV